ESIAAVQRSLARPKTGTVIDPKGGTCKSTAKLHARRGGYTLAWDNNETHLRMACQSRPAANRWEAAGARHSQTTTPMAIPRIASMNALRLSTEGDSDLTSRHGETRQHVLSVPEVRAAAGPIRPPTRQLLRPGA